jgi:murein L,D-transpeptidase YafK
VFRKLMNLQLDYHLPLERPNWSASLRKLGSFPTIWGICIVLLSLSATVSTGTERTGGNDTNIVIRKSKQILELYQNGKRIKTYRVCLGLSPEGPKRITGDKKTPEGDYYICYKNTKSQFHRFLGLSYPGEEDAQTAFKEGLISLDKRNSIINTVKKGRKPPWNTKLGGWVGIHGYPSEENAARWVALLYPKPHNWTDGCIAMWNYEIEELFSLVPIGTPVTIVP